MRSALLFLLCMLTSPLFGQKVKWAQAFQNPKSDKVNCIRTDKDGNVFIAGYFTNAVVLGTNNLPLNNTYNTYSKETLIAKLDSNGVCLWARSGGETFDDRVSGLAVDGQGNSIITGTYWQSGSGINFGSGIMVTGSGSGDQCFVVKYDNAGTPLWGRSITNASSGDDQGLDCATDNADNIYVVGFMQGNTLKSGPSITLATNTNPSTNKIHSYWLAKLDASGTPLWGKCFGNLPFDTSYGKYIERDIAVCTDNFGGVYITGGFDHTWPFGNTTLTSKGGYDVFVMKYDTAGNFIWAMSGGSKKDDWSNGICADNQGNIYVTGEHRDSLIYDSIIIKNYNGRDVFVMKLDAATGKPYWGKRAGTQQGGERGNWVVADTACNVYVGGDVFGGAQFGDNITTPPGDSTQSFVAKISPEGKWKWVFTGGGSDDEDRCSGIALGLNGQLFAGGFYRKPATFGSAILSHVGSSDAWYARIDDSTYGKGSDVKLLAQSRDSIKCVGDTLQYFIPTPDKYASFDYFPKSSDVNFNAALGQLVFTFNTTTTYTLAILGKDFCAEPDTVIFTLTAVPWPVADFALNPVNVPNTAPTFTLTNASTNAAAYTWLVNDSLLSTNQNDTVTFKPAKTYCFKLIATNTEGCSDTIEKCGRVFSDERVIVPNAFTVNNDGLNPSIIPVFFNIEKDSIKDYRFEVLDRFGTVVFRSIQVGEGWNGDYLATKLPCEFGTYFYYIRYSTSEKKNQVVRGDIQLLK